MGGTPSRRFRVVDLFCGAGGFSEGFLSAGFAIVAATDADPDACATYSLNFRETHTIYGDIRKPSIREQVLEASAGAHVVVGGPPCQAFSQVRNHDRLISDPRNSLYREFVRIVSKLEPPAFVMENVLGLQQMGVKEEIREDLSLDGAYDVTAIVLDAADFGVPQTRKRLFFVGARRSARIDFPPIDGSGAVRSLGLVRRKGSGRFLYEPSEHRTDLFAGPLLERLLDPEDETIVTVEQAIGDLASLRTGSRDDVIDQASLKPASSAYQRAMRLGSGTVVHNVSVPRVNRDTVLRLSKLPCGGNYLDLPVSHRKRYLTGDLWGPSNGTGQLGRKHYYAYRKLHPQFWSWTLNTKADCVYHYEDYRALSVRELARLQSFPDRFILTTDPRRGHLPGRIEGGAAHSRYRQVGNAVPPLLARAIAQKLSMALADKAPRRPK